MRNVGNFLSRKPLRRNLMANRVNDRQSQAEGDLKHAANARKDGDYDWYGVSFRDLSDQQS